MNLNQLEIKLKRTRADEIQALYRDVKQLMDKNFFPKGLKYKDDLITFLINACKDEKFAENFRKNILDKELNALYSYLIWEESSIDTSKANELFGIKFPRIKLRRYERYDEKLQYVGLFIKRKLSQDYGEDIDYLHIDNLSLLLLRQLAQKPQGYYLQTTDNLENTKYEYKNEDEVLEFISTIKEMLKDNLILFGKNSEKPMSKSLNFLKSATPINEFFIDKKLSLLATDMLTRSFSFYYRQCRFKRKEYESLKEFFKMQFDNRLFYFISRLFVTHLKKVRLDPTYSSERELFDITKLIINNLPKDGWVDFQGILTFCKYRDLRFDFNSSYKTSEYYFESSDKYTESSDITKEYYISGEYYRPLFFEPILKAVFYYLGSLGVVELKYDDPISPHKITSKENPYISIWDGLKYIKLTQLGRYVLGYEKSYHQKKIEKQQKDIKFDEYKPIITIDKSDTILLSKLESYTVSYDANKYILNYNKIFRDCKTLKALELKIESFYKIFATKPTKVFDQFFDEIKNNANMLKKDLKLITIELQNNKKLLNLFMTNKKLQELTIKASGYRVLVAKDDIPKLTKIIKENGFFIEF